MHEPEVMAVRRARLRVIRGPDSGRELELGEQLSITIGTDADSDLVLTDDSVSMRHAELHTQPFGFVVRDLGSTNGTRVGDLLVREVVVTGKTAELTLGDTVLRLTTSRDEVTYALSERPSFGAVLGQSAIMRSVFAQLERASAGDSPVLLEGPPGSGKEIVATELHARSARAAGPFVSVECGALAGAELDAAAWGAARGSMPAASEHHRAFVAEAAGGTLFLDDVSHLTSEGQRALERLVDERARLDVRIIAGSQRDLRRLVDAGAFDEGLYFKLAVAKIVLPALRYRTEDIPLLARAIVRQLRPELDADQVLLPEVLAAFVGYGWPGNVRELRHVIERLLAMGELSTGLRKARPGPVAEYAQARRDAIDRFERDYCTRVMEASGDVVVEAARRAGLSRQMWHRLLKKHGIGDEI